MTSMEATRRRSALGWMRWPAVFVLGIVVTAAVVLGPWYARTEHRDGDVTRGYHWPYVTYVSDAAEQRKANGQPVTLLVLPNNTGRPDDDPDVHARDAWTRSFGSRPLAEQLGVVTLVPCFPRPRSNWRVYTHALDRDSLTTDIAGLQRLDLQLIAMIDAVRADLEAGGFEVRDRVLIAGFSANGMFALRFTFLHPERVLACASGSPGGWPIAPVRRHEDRALRYPVGVDDLQALVGRPLALDELRRVPILVYMGDQDDNDSVDFGDGYDKPDTELVEALFGKDPIDRWPLVQRLYADAGLNATFTLWPGIGHDRTGAMDAAVRGLFAEALK